MLEAKPGRSNSAIGTTVPPPTPGAGIYPDLQVQSDRPLGNGSSAICDTQPAHEGGGGVPGFSPASFEPTPAIIDGLVDFACRFSSFVPSAPCTLGPDGNERTLTSLPSGSQQFCMIGTLNTKIPLGDTVLTARVVDKAGNPGPTTQIVLRRVPFPHRSKGSPPQGKK